MYWKAWDGASQFKLVKVSLEDTRSTQSHTHQYEALDQTAVFIITLLLVKSAPGPAVRDDGCDDSHRKYAQQLLPVGDVWYGRLCAVEEAQEDAPSVGSVPVNLLCSLLGQATHGTVHPAQEQTGY